MTVLLRAAPSQGNAKHADEGKGSDLEMTKWSKARSKDEAAEEKRLRGYIDKARRGKAMSFVWDSWRSAGVARCLWFEQKLCRLAGRRLILRHPEVVGATYEREKKATLGFSSRRILHQTAETHCPEHSNSFLAASTELPRNSEQVKL